MNEIRRLAAKIDQDMQQLPAYNLVLERLKTEG